MQQSDDQLKSIEARLARIEKYLDMPPEKPARPAKQETVERSSATASSQIEATLSSGGWLGILAIICFVLAAGFIVKLSIESGLLSPVNRICLSTLLGFSLIGAGLYFLKYDREYISLLPAGGIIVLYLTAFAAYRLYALISFETAVISAGIISLLCVGLYARIKHPVYPMTAVIGAYLAPVALDLNVNAVFTLYYFLICSLTFTTLSIIVHSRMLVTLAAYFAFILTTQIGTQLNQDILITSALLTQFLIFSLGTYCYTHCHQALTEQEAWVFFPVLMIFYFAEYFFLQRISPDLAAWISLAFAAFLIALYCMQRAFAPSQQTHSVGVLFAFVAIVVAHAGYFELLSADARSWVFPIIFIAFACMPERYIKLGNKQALLVPLLVVALVLVIEYCKLAINIFFEGQVSWPVVLAAIVSMWALFIRKNTSLTQEEGYGYALLGAAHFIVILAAYRLADPLGSLAVSAVWLLYAVAVMILAFFRKDKLMANSALLVLGFAAGKALLYDASSAPTLVRIFCLLLTGLVLYGAGLLFRKISKW